jgi:hypothetical protein
VLLITAHKLHLLAHDLMLQQTVSDSTHAKSAATSVLFQQLQVQDGATAYTQQQLLFRSPTPLLRPQTTTDHLNTL